MKPLVSEMMGKCFLMSPDDALTGPAKRGDVSTLNAQTEFLSCNYPDEAAIYKLITKYIVEKNSRNEEL